MDLKKFKSQSHTPWEKLFPMIFLSRHVCCGKSGQIKFFFYPAVLPHEVGVLRGNFLATPLIVSFLL